MTEERIEMIAEARMDSLDRRYMRGEMTEPEYLEAIGAIDLWVKRQLCSTLPWWVGV